MSSEAPKPSKEEKNALASQSELLAEQAQILKDSYAQQRLLAPVLYKQMGISPIYGKDGKITGYTATTDTNQALQKEITTKLLERQKAALAGELPIDPNLTEELGTQERTLRETLFKQLGSGYETSSPGIESLARFNKNKANLYDSAARGDLSLAEQLALAEQGSISQQQGQTFGQAMNLSNNPFQAAAGFGSAAQGYNSPLAYFSNLRQQQQASSDAEMAGWASLIGSVGKTAGTLATAGTGTLFSDLFH